MLIIQGILKITLICDDVNFDDKMTIIRVYGKGRNANFRQHGK